MHLECQDLIKRRDIVLADILSRSLIEVVKILSAMFLHLILHFCCSWILRAHSEQWTSALLLTHPKLQSSASSGETSLRCADSRFGLALLISAVMLH